MNKRYRCTTRSEIPRGLQIEHRLLEGGSYTLLPHLLRLQAYSSLVRLTRHGRVLGDALKERVEVAPSTLARQVGVIGRRDETDRLRGARKHVAYIVRKRLQLVCLESNLIMDDVVMCGLRGPLQTTVRCSEGQD